MLRGACGTHGTGGKICKVLVGIAEENTALRVPGLRLEDGISFDLREIDGEAVED
jgi:hypothetical protein